MHPDHPPVAHGARLGVGLQRRIRLPEAPLGEGGAAAAALILVSIKRSAMTVGVFAAIFVFRTVLFACAGVLVLLGLVRTFFLQV